MRKVLVFALTLIMLAVPAASSFAQGGDDIVDIAVADGRFDTLVAAVQAAGLVDALKAPGPVTVFAPTDTAFAALGSSTINALLADPDTLRNILLYHVVDGSVMAADVVGLSYAPTLLGSGVDIEVRNGNVYLNGNAKVIITDIEASNGVIHVIDAVILPPAPTSKILFTADTPVLDAPGGESIGLSIERCKTADVTFRTPGFAEIETMGGWVSSDGFTPVPADYGQPNGAPVAAGC